MQKFEV